MPDVRCRPEPQNYYQYNGDRLVRLDGTSQILGI
jgi:hypothetical protein